MILFVLAFVLSFPWALLEQPPVVQVLFSVATALVLLTPLVDGLYKLSVPLVRLVVTPLFLICLLVGNEAKMAMVVSVLSGPLAVPHPPLR